MLTTALLGRVLPLVVDRFISGRDLDAVYAQEPGQVVSLAEVLAVILPDGMPGTDAELLAVTARDGTPGSLESPARGVLLALPDGRLGLSVGRGTVVESSGAQLSFVSTPGLGRYVSAWHLPGVHYVKVGQ